MDSASLRRDLLWHAVTKTLWVLFRLATRPRIRFYSPPPRTGGFILATNHVSHFDPPAITAFFPRRIDWIAMVELFQSKWSDRFFRGLRVIPVDRSGSDRNALRTAVQRLRDGRVVGIFPEGGIRDGTASMLAGAPVKPGFALLAAMSGAPVVPGVILGTDRLYNFRNLLPGRRVGIWIAYGAPLTIPNDVPADSRREWMASAYAEAIHDIKTRMTTDFALTPDDFPLSPQARMAAR